MSEEIGARGYFPRALTAFFGAIVPFGLGFVHLSYWILVAYCVLYALIFNSGPFRALVGMEASHVAHDGLYWVARIALTIVLISLAYEAGRLVSDAG